MVRRKKKITAEEKAKRKAQSEADKARARKRRPVGQRDKKRKRWRDAEKVPDSENDGRPIDRDWRRRHEKRERRALSDQEQAAAAFDAAGGQLKVTNNGQHWTIRFTDGDLALWEWWPRSAKLVFNKNWRRGIHVHNWRDVLRTIRQRRGEPDFDFEAFESWLSGDGEDDEPIDVYRDGKIHVRKSMCDTCIFLPENKMMLQPGRVESMVVAAGEDGCIPCHQTIHGQSEHQSICFGFWSFHRNAILQVAERLGVVEFEG